MTPTIENKIGTCVSKAACIGTRTNNNQEGDSCRRFFGPTGDERAHLPTGEWCENTGVYNLQHSTKPRAHDTAGPMGDERADLPAWVWSETIDVYHLQHSARTIVYIT